MNEPKLIPMPQTVVAAPKPDAAQPYAEPTPANPVAPSAVRQFLNQKSSGKVPDGAFSGLMLL